MRGSKKGQEPPVLTDWRAEHQSHPPPSWGELQNPQKRDVLVALLQEQEHVCVYCGKGITPDPTVAHIEHFRPQSKHPHLRFDWMNLFASCGPAGTKKVAKICGDKKGNWDPAGHIEPTDPQCQEKFSYAGNGSIWPSQIGGSPAKTMINRLALDDAILNEDRKNIISELEERIRTGELVSANKNAEIEIWRSLDTDGRTKSWSHVAIRYLEDEDF